LFGGVGGEEGTEVDLSNDALRCLRGLAKDSTNPSFSFSELRRSHTEGNTSKQRAISTVHVT